jgi:hypothetical protein
MFGFLRWIVPTAVFAGSCQIPFNGTLQAGGRHPSLLEQAKGAHTQAGLRAYCVSLVQSLTGEASGAALTKRLSVRLVNAQVNHQAGSHGISNYQIATAYNNLIASFAGREPFNKVDEESISRLNKSLLRVYPYLAAHHPPEVGSSPTTAVLIFDLLLASNGRVPSTVDTECRDASTLPRVEARIQKGPTATALITRRMGERDLKTVEHWFDDSFSQLGM